MQAIARSQTSKTARTHNSTSQDPLPSDQMLQSKTTRKTKQLKPTETHKKTKQPKPTEKTAQPMRKKNKTAQTTRKKRTATPISRATQSLSGLLSVAGSLLAMGYHKLSLVLCLYAFGAPRRSNGPVYDAKSGGMLMGKRLL